MTTMNESVIQMMNARIENKLNLFAGYMEDGVFLNMHNDEVEQCSAIVMLESGDVCPIFKDYICCLNPLRLGGEGEPVKLSTTSIAGNIYPRLTVEKTVEAYNEDLLKYTTEYNLPSFGRHAIVGYHSFDPEW